MAIRVSIVSTCFDVSGCGPFQMNEVTSMESASSLPEDWACGDSRLANSAVYAYASGFAIVKFTSRLKQILHRAEIANNSNFLMMMMVMVSGVRFHREEPNQQHAEDGILRQ